MRTALTAMVAVAASIALAGTGQIASPTGLSAGQATNMADRTTFSSATAGFSPGATGIGDPYVPGEGNGGYRVSRYLIDLRFHPGTDRIQATTEIRARATQGLSQLNFDLYGLTVTAVTVDGRPATFSRAPRELIVRPVRGVPAGHSFTVSVSYRGRPRILDDPNLGESGWFNTKDGATVVGEPEAGMFWFPVNEHPSDKALIKVSATVPEGLTAVSNGLPLHPPATHRGWTTFTWSSKHPMASYLATLSIGKFRIHTFRSSTGLRIRNYVDPSLPRSADRSLDRAGEIIDFFENRFGAYPFEAAGGIADNYTSYYALENQTRPTYDRATVAWGGLTRTVAHELAHQWYGDSVALRRWKDIWLNEGFATYAEWMWRAHDGGPSVGAQFGKAYSVKATSAFWSRTVTDPGYAHLFDGPSYDRGAMALHALRLEVGSTTFFKILRAWATQNKDGHGTTAQFEELAEQQAAVPLGSLFDTWLRLPSKPADPR